MEYLNDRKNKELKKVYKEDNKAYTKAFNKNTTYHKGVVKQQVGQDASRKYLSAAKKVKRELDLNPNNKTLQKKYTQLMSNHDVERAKARRAVEVGKNRMLKQASIKRKMTMTVKAAASTATIVTGVAVVNTILAKHNVTLNNKKIYMSADDTKKFVNIGKKLFKYSKYFY